MAEVHQNITNDKKRKCSGFSLSRRRPQQSSERYCRHHNEDRIGHQRNCAGPGSHWQLCFAKTPSSHSRPNATLLHLIAWLARLHFHLLGRVGTMARIGLRMMPPFPWSPLSSVRRVFPSTAGRLAFQVVPFLMSLRLSQHQAYPAPH
jgi:hypothetical protein